MFHLERILPRQQKRTNHVYLASEEFVFPSDAAPASEDTTIINDDDQLSNFVGEFRRSSKLKNPGTGKKLIDNILRSTQINLVFVKIDLTKWVNENPIDVSSFNRARYVVLREDNVSDNNLSEFLSIFCNTAPILQPQMIILPNVTGTSIEHRLRYTNSNITASWLGTSRHDNISIPRAAPSTIDEFAGLFDRRCFEAVARVDSRQLKQWSDETSVLTGAAVRLAHLRARILTAERHEVEPEVDSLLFDLDRITDRVISNSSEPYLLMRSLALLQKAYCAEGPTYLNEALAISSTLGHELGVAMCLRCAHFLDVHPALESHMLTRAEEIFRRHDCTDLSIYCANNRLVSRFSVDGDMSEGFGELVARIEEDAPTIHRRGDILYNMAVEQLFAGRLNQAYDSLRLIDLSNARPLVVACARLGLLTCELLKSGHADSEEGLRLISFVQTNVAPSNRWHITNLFLNILALFRNKPTNFKSIYQRVKSQIDLSSGLDVRDLHSENRVIATRIGLDNYDESNELSGRFGQFFDRTGVAMPYFFIWS